MQVGVLVGVQPLGCLHSSPSWSSAFIRLFASEKRIQEEFRDDRLKPELQPELRREQAKA